jgi:dTDP-4-amino-4,6-dideoxygalactose transaminase
MYGHRRRRPRERPLQGLSRLRIRSCGFAICGAHVSDGIRLARPDVGEPELQAVAEVLASGQLTMGPKVAEFEELLARACSVEHAVAVSSGTAALHLSMLALGIGPGDEVVVPAYTFPATANAVELCGARAVLADVDPVTLDVEPARVYDAVGPRTKAVVVVHLFGRPAEWEAIQTAVPADVALVEDAAGALGARRQGVACGSLGVMGCLSFHPRKIVTTGEGGAVTTSIVEYADSVRRLRHHGIVPGGAFDIPAPGLNYRLADILCAVGIPQLVRLEALLRERERVAALYTDRLEHVVETPTAAEGDRHGWQAYVVLLDRRDEALAALRAKGIEAQIGTWALHRLGAYRDRGGSFPGADRAFDRALALPFATAMTEAEVDRVVAAVTPFAGDR